jgi:2-polyprenyl-3-methyl-5-hydroxy-6-metoxy-1,4-benzoquinol methylase
MGSSGPNIISPRKVVEMSLKALSPTYYARITAVQKRIKNAKRLLDAGCSDGYLDSVIKNRVEEIFGIDINWNDIRIAKMSNPRNIYDVGSLYELPYKSGYFDIVVCLDVLEHLHDDEKAISELTRILKIGGKLIITVPSAYFPFTFDPINYLLKIFNKHLNFGIWGFGHVRLYSMSALSEKLKKYLLKPIETEYLSHLLTGALENSYLISLFQPGLKSDPNNRDRVTIDMQELKRRLSYEPPLFLRELRDIIIKMDKILFGHSKTSINILVTAMKVG